MAVALPATDNDAGLLTLEEQFNALAAELVAAQRSNSELGVSSDLRPFILHNAHTDVDVGKDYETTTREVEAILARLCPIERSIMATPARTIAGLGVKARHAAYVTSQYWSAPVDKFDWDAQAVRLLIEAVCDLANAQSPCR
jgi:hypothetical protein